ncbi:MAG TPA: hypothetical protein VFA59_21235 [Vicinamibacterales bacterium]|nr:hypothetical protein [Vicinamibacterales bacterium]
MRVFRALVVVAVAVHAAVLGARLISTLRFSALVPVPIEGPGIYAIWKVQHGFPLYEWPTRPFFALTLYNFLFYKTYAWVLRLGGATAASLPLGAHLLTLVWAGLGAVAQYAVTTVVLDRVRVRDERWFVAAAAFLIWFGAGVMGRWTLMARADVAALALAVTAVAIVIRSLEQRGLGAPILAGAMFFLAWGFKQSVVGIFAGVCVFELFARRDLRRAFAIALPFAVLCGISLVVGGPVYRFNILTAASLSTAVIPWLALYWYRSIVIANLPVWIGAAAGLAHVFRRSGDARWRDPVFALMTCTIATTFVLDAVLLSKGGAAINHTFEFWVMTSLCAVVSFSILVETSPRAVVVGCASMVLPIVFGLTVLAGGPPRAMKAITTIATYEPTRFGTDAEFAWRDAVRARMTQLPKPLFVNDEILGQPWYATDSGYPAVVLDGVFYSAAEGQGRLERDGVLSLIDDRYFATLIVPQPPWVWTRRAVAAGYEQKASLSAGDSTWVIFVRSDTAPRRSIHSRRPTSRKTP